MTIPDDDSTKRKRWTHLRRVLERAGPYKDPNFEPSTELLSAIESVRILIIGAGGLGCELLKDMALMGFCRIDIIDMDTIDLANLNRQFLFTKADIGKSKAEIAAKFILNRIPNCNVTPHMNKIQDFDASFYSQFRIIVCGLDSIVARRWINSMLVSMLQYDENNQVVPTSIIPLIDGGTEGFKGNARVIMHGYTSCIECTLDLFPPQVNFPQCTIANNPRLPEHCVEWVTSILWPKEKPFGPGVNIDGDSIEHIQWIVEHATKRANEHNITGINFRFTQGVVKRVIPAVASTNAVIASICATEVFKLATSSVLLMNNYTMFNDIEGIYMLTYPPEKREDCPICSNVPVRVQINETAKFQELVDQLIEKYQLIAPLICTQIDGKSKTLYMTSTKQMLELTKPHLRMTLQELGLANGTELLVGDPARASSMRVIISLTSSMETTTAK
ncbi:unnamed protein product [Rotaria socialis]|uniref:NEDD8-activating enzyme E1 catalytic subunit n=2 Tax=Rotaria socialis TaxID=392032 RepID=A0A817PY99_9BILA|nr:unnamed protein product [Rotaria socialis]CAF4211146.1 unnamed protein product [Rotaria socialis]